MNVFDVALVAATGAAAALSLTFVAMYARLRWETTPTGRSVMALSVAVAGLSCVALAKRWDELHPAVSWAHELSVLVTCGWAVVAGVFAWRICALLRHRGGK